LPVAQEDRRRLAGDTERKAMREAYHEELASISDGQLPSVSPPVAVPTEARPSCQVIIT
jgi:hypothetical protein